MDKGFQSYQCYILSTELFQFNFFSQLFPFACADDNIVSSAVAGGVGVLVIVLIIVAVICGVRRRNRPNPQNGGENQAIITIVNQF